MTDRDKIERAREELESAYNGYIYPDDVLEATDNLVRSVKSALAILSESSAEEPESDERVLLWDRGLQGYCAEPGEMVHDYRKAKQYKRGVFDLLSPDVYALADLSGWVESWGEQPVSDGVRLETSTVDGGTMIFPADGFAWRRSRAHSITHFRLPLPVEEAADTATLVREATKRRAEEQAPTLEQAAEEKVRRIVREELAADHRATAGWLRSLGFSTMEGLHNRRADELEGEKP